METINKTIKVLLIEDNRADALLLKQFFVKLEKEQFELNQVRLLQEGLNYLKENDVDIILLDLSLPDSSGLESLEAIQGITVEIPIIVLTGMDDDENALAALRGGAQDYIVKNNLFRDLLLRSINYAIERKQIMEKLRQSEARYRGVVEDQTELICRFLTDGTITFVNETYCRYFEKSAAELLGQNIRSTIVDEDWLILESHFASLCQEKPTDTVEFRIIAPNGKIYWQQWHNRAIFDGSKIIEYQAVGRDITEFKQAEKEKACLISSLHESEERFRILANTAPVLMWMTDAEGQCSFFNQSWLTFTGLSLEEELFNGWIARVHPKEQEKCWNYYKTALQERSHFQLEHRLLRADGEYRWVINTGIPRFIGSGKFAGFICSCVDITERKQAEEILTQQAQRDRTLAEITQHIHESLDLEAIISTAVAEINQFLQAEKIIIAKLYEVEGSPTLQGESLFERVQPDSVFSPQRNLHSSPKCQMLFQLSDLKEVGNCNLNLKDSFEKILAQLSVNWQKLQQGEVIVAELVQPLTSNSVSLTKLVTPCCLLIVPIMYEKKLWGLLYAQESSKPRQWQLGEIELLKQISVQLAIAIHQAELYQQLEEANQELEKLAVVDGLTQIANRRKFDEYIRSEWFRLAREKAPLSMILCDLDYFKVYNDTYGHQAGDLCLQQVAQTIEKSIKRPADLAARYGGEELAVILPNTTPEGAEKVAQQICARVKALNIAHENSPIAKCVTLSAGVAGCIPHHHSNPQILIETADRALYEAKNLGRNQVVRKTINQDV